MDYQSNQNFQNYRPQPKNSPTMERAAFALGVAALVSSMFVYPSLICGALGMILALLSKGGELQMTGKAKAAFGLSLGGLIFTILLIVVSYVVAYFIFGGTENMVRFFEEMQNMSTQEIYDVLFEKMNQIYK